MPDTLDSRVQLVEERLSRLEDERAVLAALYRYAHAIDYGDDATWVDCFTEAGAFDLRRRPNFQPGAGQRFEGRDELAAFIATHPNAPAVYTKHVVVEPIIAIDGDTATVVSYLFRLDEHDGEPYVFVFGRYRDRMARGPDGVWRFEERVVEIESLHQR
jgi:hypothetical protein